MKPSTAKAGIIGFIILFSLVLFIVGMLLLPSATATPVSAIIWESKITGQSIDLIHASVNEINNAVMAEENAARRQAVGI